METNVELARMLDQLQHDKNRYRHELASRVENLLLPLVKKLVAGKGRLSPEDVGLLEQRLQMVGCEDLDGFDENMAKLSRRERAVCELIRAGAGSREIAQQLGLSPETVNKHRQAIRRKLQIDHRGINLSSYLRSR
jgi:DNA-binding CsgD family transcriptional regulator